MRGKSWVGGRGFEMLGLRFREGLRLSGGVYRSSRASEKARKRESEMGMGMGTGIGMTATSSTSKATYVVSARSHIDAQTQLKSKHGSPLLIPIISIDRVSSVASSPT